MVHGREPYDAHTIAMLHAHRMAHSNFLGSASPGHSEQPTLLRYASGSGRKLSQTDLAFISRMDMDVDARRHSAFVAEVKKDPRFRPSMLEPPTTNFAKARARTTI